MHKSVDKDSIKKKRKELGLTQQASADLVHVDIRTWQHWEKGDTAMPYGLFELYLMKTEKKDKKMTSYSVKPKLSVYFIHSAHSGDYLVDGATSKEHAADLLLEGSFVEAKLEEMKSEILSRAEYEDIDTEKAMAAISLEECKKLVLKDLYDSILELTHEELIKRLEDGYSATIEGLSINACV